MACTRQIWAVQMQGPLLALTCVASSGKLGDTITLTLSVSEWIVFAQILSFCTITKEVIWARSWLRATVTGEKFTAISITSLCADAPVPEPRCWQMQTTWTRGC